MNTDTSSDPYKNYDVDFVAVPVTPIASEESLHTPEQQNPEQNTTPKKNPIMRFVAWVLFLITLGILTIGVFVYIQFSIPSTGASLPTTFVIQKGASLQSVTDDLSKAQLIRSPLAFRVFMILGRQESSIKSGEYTFNKPLTHFETIDKLVHGKYEYVPVRLTIREGESAFEISKSINAVFPNFAQADVYEVLKQKEGTIFPETYNFPPFATIDDIVKTTEKEFNKRIQVYANALASSSYTTSDILTIASILEREVPIKKDMRIVAGIIYNRLAQNMPLQMDSTVGYITGKASLELTLDDLKIDSPYNTYVVKGLPPTPIGNPGDASIDAALNPETHEYIYFLSDKDGVNHYAKTYTEHLKNRKLYLGK